MLVRTLKLAARHPLAALAFVAMLPVAALALVAAAHRAPDATADAPPRAVLSRIWLDRYPEKSTDEVQFWVWFGSGMGLHETGSYWRSSLDVFDFERQGDKLTIVYMQDKKSVETRFKVAACDEKPPFDLCLDLTNALGGRTRYYGFGDEDDMATRIPWSKAMLRSAEARAKSTR
jgi:hypothetical protein